MSDKFETTWVWVRNTTGCPKCGQPPGKRCIARSGRETNFLHQARRAAHIRATS